MKTQWWPDPYFAVVFVCENNHYGMGTSQERAAASTTFYTRGDYVPGIQVDGMDVLKVYQHSAKVMERMRKDRKPWVLEVLTYRYKGHSVSDPGNYRSKDEVQEQQERDPLLQMAAQLEAGKLASPEDLKKWDKEARAEVKKAEAFAEKAPEPDVSETWAHVFADNH